MRLTDYLRDRLLTMLITVLCGTGVWIYLRGVGVSSDESLLLFLCVGTVLLICGVLDFYKKYRQFNELDQIMEGLDQKYLFAEVCKRPSDFVGRTYYAYLKKASKSMIEQVTRTKVQQSEYKEFIEGWIHEIKVPITSVKLQCENDKNEGSRKILAQAERIDREVEKVLYYARSENVEHDFFIKQANLAEIVTEMIAVSKQELISNRVRIETQGLDLEVYTDKKWLTFIMGQILANSIKYRMEQSVIKIEGGRKEQDVFVTIRDNGLGIPTGELPRIFQRGFTGSNGRSGRNSTGLGLYLCKKLCDRLGIGIEAESEEGAYTSIRLIFAQGSFHEPAKLKKM